MTLIKWDTAFNMEHGIKIGKCMFLVRDRQGDLTIGKEERDKNSSRVYRMLANEVKPKSIRMKEDVPWNHENKNLPILDTQMRIVGGQVIYQHFSREKSSLGVVLKR